MLKELIKKREPIFRIWMILVIVMGAISFVYGDIEARGSTLMASVIVPFVAYGFVRLVFKIVLGDKHLKTVSLFAWFFIIVCTLGVLTSFVGFVVDFPNSFSPANTVEIGIVMGVLDSMKKRFEKEEN